MDSLKTQDATEVECPVTLTEGFGSLEVLGDASPRSRGTTYRRWSALGPADFRCMTGTKRRAETTSVRLTVPTSFKPAYIQQLIILPHKPFSSEALRGTSSHGHQQLRLIVWFKRFSWNSG
ncbi:uncharacterized protein PGTG_14954 [Puccinia graminis f. sp. tritici CRL 75-36-700-3]|uniref:Uncharacterized protein n=1 Tax=Puccinia graminis f. sp. tritici (strain CRL 75-36-700-3 / race SCCL) TaxID=418459 RepID=E3KXQ1_PUCGT|nr:uncharacterized protein PGTG_14954 [Puccinia graminis f. sp. tritici CRL 75-36-700-3]EFP89113.1 hypothetical protein PGTG_14954 [Puccinia graminis f. sp. tritici CRL 75-36-700-3]